MKAKDYAKRYEEEGKTDESLSKIVLEFLLEFKKIVEARHAESDDAGIAIIKELDRKYRVFARLAHVNPEGYMLIFEMACPESYALVKDKL